jgi:tape measure domain-containing protein
MNDISVTLSADDRALLQALREAGVSLDQFARKGAGALRDMETASHASATGIEKLAGGLKTAFIGGGVAAAIITIKNAIGGVTMAMIDAQMQADKVKNSLAFAMGGAQAAQEIQYLRQVTDQLGVSFAAVAPLYGRLAAATKGTNLEGRATREIFESIAQASVVMGLGVEETEGAMRALVQMVSKGQIQAEELRGQLGERLPRAFQIFADSMGVTTGELSKLLEMGQVGPERLAQFAATLKGELAGNLDESTTRLAANVNRLDNAWLQLKQNVGEAGVSSFMAGQMAILADATGDVAKSMEAARKGGDGFLGQMAAAGGALLRFANPFNAITYNVQDQATELKIAQEQLREFEALLGKDPTNTFLIRGIAQLKETVAWLQAANSEKDKFAASGPSHRTMEDNSMKALAEQQAKDAKELADIKAKLMGVDKDYLPTLKKLNDAYRAGNLTQKEYVGLVEELAKKNYTAAKATATHADAFGDFVRKLNEKLAAQAQELDAGRKLTDSEKLRIQFAEELGTKYKNLSAAQLAKVDGLLKAIAAGEEQARATRRLVAAYQAELDVMAELDAAYVAASKAREQGRLAVDAYVQGIAASAEQVALEQSLFGQSARNRAIALEQYQIELDLKKQIAAINANAGFDQSQRDEEIARATAAAAIAKASSVAKADMAALQSLFDAFDNTAHDVFVNIFNDGSNAFKKLGQSLKAGLIDVLYQLTLKRWIINIGASLTGGSLTGGSIAGTANAATGSGSSVLGSIGDLSSLAGIGGSLFGSTAAYAGAIGGGSLAAGSQAAMLAAQTGVFGAEGLAMTASAAGGMAGAMAPVLQGLMTAAPYLAAVAAVYMIAKSLDHSGTPHTGGGSGYSASGGLKSAAAGDVFDGGYTGLTYSDSASQMTTQIVQGIVGILDSTAVAFGKTAGYEAATSFADDSSKDGAWGALVIKHLDTTLTDWSRYAGHGEVFSDGAAGSAEYLAAISTDVRAALDSIDLPEWADKMLGKLGASASLEDLSKVVSEINQTQAVLQSLGASVKVFAGLSGDAVLNIINASGGLQAFGASLGAYYENFYSEQEKFDAKLGALNTRLRDLAGGGAFADSAAQFNKLITEPTRENFRKLVEAQDLATASGQETYAALLSLSGVVAELTPLAEAAQETAIDNAKTLLEYGQRLRDYVQGLKTGDLSTLTPGQKVAEALAQYQSTLSKARGGDQAALSNLQGVADTYLSLAREYDPASYSGGVFASVANALDDLGASLGGQNEVADLMRSLPADIAAALAPLINAGATTLPRVQSIRGYAATLPQDDSGARMLYDAAVANGVGSAELDAAMGFAAGSSLSWAVSHNLPAFEQGTNYVPRDMVAQIHRGEAIIPARYNRNAPPNDALVAEIKALRAEVSRLREQNNAGHQLGAMATERNTQQITQATVEAASKAQHAARLKERTALA